MTEDDAVTLDEDGLLHVQRPGDYVLTTDQDDNNVLVWVAPAYDAPPGSMRIIRNYGGDFKAALQQIRYEPEGVNE